MFRSKKGGAPGEKVDVGKALGEMDKEVLKQVGGEMAQTGKKEVSHRTQHTTPRENCSAQTQHRHASERGCHRERGKTRRETHNTERDISGESARAMSRSRQLLRDGKTVQTHARARVRERERGRHREKRRLSKLLSCGLQLGSADV
jgi:hypothetical protein